MNKPKGMTSHDVVDEVRRKTGEKRVGHAGTLDPFATGVLIIGIGREDTKKLGEMTHKTEKEYRAVLELGKESTTGDPEGTISQVSEAYPEEKQVAKALKSFHGEIEQEPPAFSAVKVRGVPSYKLARKGRAVKLASRKVVIKELVLEDYSPPFLKLKIVCSPGTYIRALAKDIGKKLKTGAYLTELERTRVGSYKLNDALPLSEVGK